MAGGLDGVEVRGVQRPERVIQAEDLHVRHAGQPLLGQQKADQRLCAHGEARHQRHEHIGADLDGAARHLANAGGIVLLGGQHRQQHAVEGGVGVLGDEIRELVRAVIEGEIRRGVAQADDELVELEVGRVQKLGHEELPTVGDEPAEALPGEHALRLPAHGEPEDGGVDRDVQQILEHQRPHAVAEIRERYADGGGKDRPAEGREEEAAKLHGLRHIGLLDVLHAGHHDRKPQHPHHGHELQIAVDAADEGGREEQPRVQQQAEAEIEVEHRGVVQIVRVLLLDQGIGHTAVDKDLQNGRDRRHEGDCPIERGVEKPRQHDRHDEVHHIGAAALHQAPNEIGDNGLLFIHKKSGRESRRSCCDRKNDRFSAAHS